MMQKQIKDFRGFDEITDGFNEMVEELEKLRKNQQSIQLTLKGSRAITPKQHAT